MASLLLLVLRYVATYARAGIMARDQRGQSWPFILPARWGTTTVSLGHESISRKSAAKSCVREGVPTIWQQTFPHLSCLYLFFSGFVKNCVYRPQCHRSCQGWCGCSSRYVSATTRMERMSVPPGHTSRDLSAQWITVNKTWSVSLHVPGYLTALVH
jgi:hypothetical protein